MNVRIIKKPVSIAEVESLAKEIYRDMLKGVADIEREVMALGGEWHMDANTVLLADGSRQEDVWGFNIYHGKRGDSAIEYVSLINIRPAQGNRDMEIGDKVVRRKIRSLIEKFIPELFV